MAAPPSAGRRGKVHYRGQRRQPKRRGPPPHLPPPPKLLTMVHDSATTGAAPPRAYCVGPRFGAPPPRHVCVTRQQAGLGTRGRRPHCPPQSPGTQPLFLLLVFVPHLCTGFEEFLPLSTSCARDMPVAAPPVSILEIPALTPLTFHNRRSVPTPSIPE